MDRKHYSKPNRSRVSRPSGAIRRTSKTGWNELAPWYAGWAKGGSEYQKRYGIPTTIELLALKKGLRVLDVACGAGALRDAVEKAGAIYTGVDKSPAMIAEAVKAGGKKAQFAVGNITTQPPTGKYDRTAIMFAIQDIDDVAATFKNVGAALVPGGVLVIFMLHPSFRIPRQSGWGNDAARKLTYRRMDRYRTEAAIPLDQQTGKESVTSFFYHRPLQIYTDALAAAGFTITNLKEVYSDRHAVSDSKAYEGEFPHFLAIQAKRA